MTDGPETRLASYGTLQPGQSNHHQLAGLRGRWLTGTVRGKLIPTGWAVTQGFPALFLDPAGPHVHVSLFESPDLPGHWGRLDEFEGPDYHRVPVTVSTAEGDLAAYIYEASQ